MHRRNGHHTNYHLKDERTSVYASTNRSSLDDHAYAVLNVGRIYDDGHRSSELGIYVHNLDHARQLAAAAAEILDHLRAAEGQPITKREEVSA